MNNRKPPQTDDDIIEAFAELLDQVRPETEEEIQDTLIEAGIDPDELAREAMLIVKDGLANSPYNWRNEQDALESAREELKNTTQAVPSTKTGLIDAISQMLSQSGSKLAGAYFRNKDTEGMTYEELVSFYEELIYLAGKD